MIPKQIHFCWLSDEPFPPQVERCIDSWKKNLPDYKIILWNKERFDINSTPWTKQAFEKKKYAFVSDYIRFYALFNYGGIYLDSDVEVLRNLDYLLEKKFFFSYEYSGLPEAAVIGAESGLGFIKNALDWYDEKPFINDDGSSNATVAPLVLKVNPV